MDQANASGKKPRGISHNTRTWQLFEKFFLEPAPQDYPLRIPCETWGQALNLSVGLNRCHVQHQEETGMPNEAMLYSAKPKRGEGENEEFWIEISTNYRRQGIASPSKGKTGGAWLDAMLDKAKEDALEVFPRPGGAKLAREDGEGKSLPEEDKQEALLKGFLGEKK